MDISLGDADPILAGIGSAKNTKKIKGNTKLDNVVKFIQQHYQALNA